jgi:hypothetical protein
MINALTALRNYLITRDGIDALAGDRIYASPYLPKNYVPDLGPALLFNIRGGGQDYSSQVLSPSFQFRSYAIDHAQAIELDQALYDNLNDAFCIDIKMARMETVGQMLNEPQTGWPYILSFYRVHFNNN